MVGADGPTHHGAFDLSYLRCIPNMSIACPADEAECRQLLAEWNSTGTDFPSDRCIHALFEEQAALTPEAVALVFGDEEMTYRQLDARANQVAHLLADERVVRDLGHEAVQLGAREPEAALARGLHADRGRTAQGSIEG